HQLRMPCEQPRQRVLGEPLVSEKSAKEEILDQRLRQEPIQAEQPEESREGGADHRGRGSRPTFRRNAPISVIFSSIAPCRKRLMFVAPYVRARYRIGTSMIPSPR